MLWHSLHVNVSPKKFEISCFNFWILVVLSNFNFLIVLRVFLWYFVMHVEFCLVGNLLRFNECEERFTCWINEWMIHNFYVELWLLRVMMRCFLVIFWRCFLMGLWRLFVVLFDSIWNGLFTCWEVFCVLLMWIIFLMF